MPKHKHIDELDYGQLIHIIDHVHGLTVHAPMPDTMTIGTGSEIGSPFAGYASDGTAAKVLALTTGASNKIGIVTQRLFMGVDQPDINLDLKFVAYYSALNEVLIPCVKLMLMATAEERGLENDIKNYLRGLEVGNEIIKQAVAKIKNTETYDTDKFINYLRTPAVCKVKFGNIFTVKQVFLSSVSVSFSNILDSDFLPMEATVSVTLTPQNPFTKNEIITMFKKRITVKSVGNK